MKNTVAVLVVALAATPALAHVGAFANGMYCRNGASNVDSPNTNTVVNPLWNLEQKDWWMQADRGCPNYPPPAGEFLELPVGGTFTVELAFNRAFTTLSYNGTKTSDWPDGGTHPDDWNGFSEDPGEGCIQGAGGALHVQNQGNATGTAFAISYNSNLSQVTMDNLVVFTVAEHTPWKRVTTYQVPADLPPCPEGGCHCTFGWAPNGCGQRNVYLQPYKCNVVGSTSTRQVAQAKPPVYCGNDASNCTSGAKQVIIFAQASGNNVVPEPGRSPGYNAAWGFAPGAQNDIYTDSSSASESSNASSTGNSSNVSAISTLPSAVGRAALQPSSALNAGSNNTYSNAQILSSSLPSNWTFSSAGIKAVAVSSTLSAPVSAPTGDEESCSDDTDDEVSAAPIYASSTLYASVTAAASTTFATSVLYTTPSVAAQAPGLAAVASLGAGAAAPSVVAAAAPSANLPVGQAVQSQPAQSLQGLEARLLQTFIAFIDAACAQWRQAQGQ